MGIAFIIVGLGGKWVFWGKITPSLKYAIKLAKMRKLLPHHLFFTENAHKCFYRPKTITPAPLHNGYWIE